MQRRDLLMVLAATTAMGIPTTMAFAADQTMNVDVCIVGAFDGSPAVDRNFDCKDLRLFHSWIAPAP